MPSNEDEVIEDILAFLDASVVQPVHEQGIPNSETVLRNDDGDIEPYYAIQFGDGQQSRTTSFIGPRGDDYVMPVYIQAIASESSIARRMATRIRDFMLGKSFNHATGQTRKRPGGGMFSMTTSNGATEAYQAPASFGVPFQFETL